MSEQLDEPLSYEEAQVLSMEAAKVFRPRTPITSREMFAGRWTQLTTIVDAVNQPGLHVVIYGERGVGKTSLANVLSATIRVLGNNEERLIVKTVTTTGDSFSSIWAKLFRDLSLVDNRPVIGLRPATKGRVPLLEAYGLTEPVSVDDVRRVLTNLEGSVMVIDEFDRAGQDASKETTDLIKTLSDFGIDSTVVLVGVSDTIDKLVSDHASIVRAITQVFLPRMAPDELKDIITNAEDALSVKFSEEAANLTAHICQGLPHYAHLIGLNAVRVAAIKNYSRRIERADVFMALEEATKQAEQSTREKHTKATHSSHKDALYREVLLACAIAAAQSNDSLGYFNPATVVEPLHILLQRYVEIATFNTHLSEFCQEKRGPILERVGQPRAYRYRFHDPMVVPFVFMDAVIKGTVSEEQLAAMLD
jgi:Cdc6-like AAA superfamily ATPase